MRRARTAAAITAAILTGGALASPAAHARPADADAPAQEAIDTAAADGTTSGTVVLPTGDQVTVLENGTAAIEPAEGREHIDFITPTMFDGSDEIIAVPFDRVADIEAGLENPRRYNVTKLLEAGVTDAAAAPASALDERDYTGLVPDDTGESTAAADGAQQFSVVLRDRAGAVPDLVRAEWTTLDGSASGPFFFDENGVGSEALAPGDYAIVYEYLNQSSDTERGERLLGMAAVTVGDSQDQFLVDAAAAQPVRADVERDDAEYFGAPVFLTAQSETEEPFGLATGGPTAARTDVYLMPEPDLPEFRFTFMYQPTFVSPEGSADPYTYNLALGEFDAYPSDTEYVIADDELAQVETEFHDFGTAMNGHTCDYGDFKAEEVGYGICRFAPVELPSTRTMLYTAGPEIGWNHGIKAGVYGELGNVVDGFNDNQENGVVYEAGQTERTVLNGGFTAGIPTVGREPHGDFNRLGGLLNPAFSFNGESLEQVAYEGTVSISSGGDLIAESEHSGTFGLDMPDVPGRYTLEVDSAYVGTTSDFATASSQSWEFDLGPMPDEGAEELFLPVVGLSIEGAQGGWVEDDGSVEVTLQALAGSPVAPIDVESMTFEVSYNDGRTWRRVPIDLDGGTAEAEFCPPRRAEFVSVRMTAVDTAGTEVSHTTIRSFGLE
jgi:hypothetical protein